MVPTASERGCAAVAAAVTLLLDRTAALAAGLTSQCEVSEYYDVRTGQCRHCDVACFQRENGTVVGFLEESCFALCPGYIREPRIAERPGQPPDDATASMSSVPREAVAVVVALVLLACLLALAWLVLARCGVLAAVKRGCHPDKGLRGARAAVGSCIFAFGSLRDQADAVRDSSYFRLSDPSEEVELVERVTCL